MSEAEKSAYAKLPPERRKFVDLLVRGKNGTDAVRLLRPHSKAPWVIASKWKAMPEVRAAIIEREEEAMEAAGITNAQILFGIARIARLSIKDFVHKDGRPKAVHELDDDVAMAVQSLEVESTAKDGVVLRNKFRTPPKLDALKLLGQYRKLFTDNIDLRTPDGVVIEVVKFAGKDADKAASP